MRALSIQQPWASLVVHGFKRIETRTWPTLHRGPLAIHAAGRFRKSQRDRCHDPPFRDCLAAAGIHRLRDFPLGCIVGVVTVLDCVPVNDVLDQLDARERHFGDFGHDRHAWLLAEPMPLTVPIPCVGQLGLFGLPEEILWELTAHFSEPGGGSRCESESAVR